MTQKVFSIALDGPSGAGKSTVAKAVAQRLDILYLDTGAMYRAIGIYMLRAGVDITDEAAVTQALSRVDVRVRHEGGAQRTYLAEDDVSDAIRTPEASEAATCVSRLPAVRARLVAMQREIVEGIPVIMDGRDIGTHVLPGATLKIFLVASPDVRAQRRYEELRIKDPAIEYEKVKEDMIARDRADSTRAVSPLTKADDAVEVNTDELSPGQVADVIVGLLNEKLEKKIP